ncbi:MAG: ATP-binding cassette domain-containing protein [Synergistales bacterium]|nr:ATP-binding cassette domain-containing protein [Synergistales bacterium]
MATKLVTEKLSAWFGKKQVLKAVSIAFEEKQVTALVGPSGCGKSTFIR